jgi:hypothetical protein
VHELLEYPRRLYVVPSVDDTPEVIFTEGQRIRGFTWTNDNTDAEQTVNFIAGDGVTPYFSYIMTRNSSGFVPVQFFATGLVLAATVVDKEVAVTVFVATPGGNGEVIEL